MRGKRRWTTPPSATTSTSAPHTSDPSIQRRVTVIVSQAFIAGNKSEAKELSRQAQQHDEVTSALLTSMDVSLWLADAEAARAGGGGDLLRAVGSANIHRLVMHTPSATPASSRTSSTCTGCTLRRRWRIWVWIRGVSWASDCVGRDGAGAAVWTAGIQ